MDPLIPRPAITLITLALTAILVSNVWVRGDDGVKTTLILATAITAIIGREIFQRRGDR